MLFCILLFGLPLTGRRGLDLFHSSVALCSLCRRRGVRFIRHVWSRAVGCHAARRDAEGSARPAPGPGAAEHRQMFCKGTPEMSYPNLCDVNTKLTDDWLAAALLRAER